MIVVMSTYFEVIMIITRYSDIYDNWKFKKRSRMVHLDVAPFKFIRITAIDDDVIINRRRIFQIQKRYQLKRDLLMKYNKYNFEK